MAYAERELVLSRAGRLSAAWDEETQPGYADIDVHLGTVADELDAAFAVRGISVPFSAAVQGALAGVNADGALVLMIEGSWPGGRGNDETKAIYEGAKTRYSNARAAIAAGTFEGLALAMEEAGGGEADAADFWSTETDYGYLTIEERRSLNPWLLPEAERGMKF